MAHGLAVLEALEPRLLLNSGSAAIGRTVLASRAGRIQIEYRMPELELHETAPGEPGQMLCHADLADAPVRGEVGRPVLPVVPVRVVLPMGWELGRVEVQAEKKVTLEGTYLIEQGRGALAFGPEPPGKASDADAPAPFDLSIYGSDDPFPKARFDGVQVQRRRGVNILMVNLNPVEYLPSSGQVSCFGSMVVTVDLIEARAKDPPDGAVIRYRPDTIAPIGTEVDNPDAMGSYTDTAPTAVPGEGATPDRADTYEYVVITNQSMVDASTDYTIHDFIAHKQSQGFSATVVTTESIYAKYTGVDDQEKLRNFITDAYNNWGTDYVLLAGDANIIPARSLRAEASDEIDDIPSDLYYQCLDGSFDYDGDRIWGEPNDGPGGSEVDLMAEVYIGRAPAENADEMANWVYKTIAYENDPASEHRNHAAIVGEYLSSQFGPSKFSYAEPYMEEIRLGSSAAGYTTAGFATDGEIVVDTLYDINGEWEPEELIAMVNSDTYGLINHLGHADTDYVMKLYNSDVDGLANERSFFIYSQGCYSGNFVSDAIAEHFTTSTRHGAMAVVFNSRYGWGEYNDSYETLDSPSQRLNRQFWDALFSEGINRLGAMNADSHEDNIWCIGDDAIRWVIYETTLFGDPAIEVGSVAVEGIDLRGTDFDVMPDNLRVSASTAAVSFTVNNRGDTDAGAFDVQFYYSDDNTIDPASDTLLQIEPSDPNYDPIEPEAYHIVALEAGADHAGTVSLIVPVADPFGTDDDYYIGMFVDADLDVAEAHESNNRSNGMYRDYDDVYYDFAGPQVDSHSPDGAVIYPQMAMRFRFGEPMDTGSFAADDVVSFRGPPGDLMGEITGYAWLDSRTLEVRFNTQKDPGTYTMVIGPGVSDESGNLMNQDGDAANGEAIEDRYRARFNVIDVIYSAGMDSDPGWTLDSGSGPYRWQWGAPTGGGSHDGDPTSGYTGNNVMGYNLSGDYPNDLYSVEYATTPPIDCSGFEDVTLSFYRWLGVESAEYDEACVQISNDGVNWVDLWGNPTSDVFDSSWSYQEFDVSAVANDQPTVYVRWGMGPTDYLLSYPGWNLDDVIVACHHPPVAADDLHQVQPGVPLRVGPEEGVLANDTAGDLDDLTAAPVAGPDGGDLTLFADGSFNYEPYPDFYGRDSFIYVADDGRGVSDPCTVTLNVVIPGDADLNRRVDFLDYLQLKKHLGTPSGAAWANADFNRDGAVGRDDFMTLHANFGRSIEDSTSPPPSESAEPPAPAHAAEAPVPAGMGSAPSGDVAPVDVEQALAADAMAEAAAIGMLLRDGGGSATSALASPARGAVGPDTPLTARVAEEVLPLRLAQRLPARGVTAVPDETDAIEATDEPAATAPDAEPLDVLSLPKLLPLAVPML